MTKTQIVSHPMSSNSQDRHRDARQLRRAGQIRNRPNRISHLARSNAAGGGGGKIQAFCPDDSGSDPPAQAPGPAATPYNSIANPILFLIGLVALLAVSPWVFGRSPIAPFPVCGLLAYLFYLFFQLLTGNRLAESPNPFLRSLSSQWKKKIPARGRGTSKPAEQDEQKNR
jgi:hypothetical protein